MQHTRVTIPLAAVTALVVSATPACKNRDVIDTPQRAENEQEPSTAANEAADQPSADEISDANITRAVERELLFDHITPGVKIDVVTTDGVVALTGKVGNLLEKQRATLVAEHVKGVRTVSDRLELVNADEVDDETLTNDINEALLFDPAAESYELEVSAKDGVVTLTGSVDSWAERQLSERIARSIRGVKAVDNQVTIDAPAERSDEDIAADVEARLRWDVLVDHDGITTTVEDGVVTLTGTVGSAAQRRRAGFDAWTSGTRDVRVDDLEVVWTARDEQDLRDPSVQTASATQIRDAILDAATYDPRVYSFDIGVEVTGSRVTLTGEVDNAKAKQAAEQLARNTVGVAHVVNEIEVKPGPDYDDAQLEDRIEARLLTNVYTDAYEIGVDVAAGVATLTGTVDSYLEKAEAEDVAYGVDGVMFVTNLLEVEDTDYGYFYDPYFYPYHPYVYPWSTYAPPYDDRSDEQIEDDVEFELRWSPFVEASQVTVDVAAGRVTLTGTVDSWRERDAAEEEAYEGGALSVDNLLNVDLG